MKVDLSRVKIALISLIFALAFQMTDVKIFDVKIGEFFFLVIFIFLSLFKFTLNKFIFYFYLFIIFLLIETFYININTEFFIPSSVTSVLKQPYFISVARAFELLSCITVVSFLYYMAKNKRYFYLNRHYFFSMFFKINSLFSIFFIIVYLLHIFDIYQSTIIYGPTNRLRGFFVEGGPLGLYYAQLFVMGVYLGASKFSLLLYLITIYLAQSKAGILFILFFMTFSYAINKRIYLKLPLIVISLLFVLFSMSIIARNYLEDIKNVEILLQLRKDDPNFVMGRIAGLFIGSEMIKQHPLFGVGLGNYSLVRNNPAYRGIFPAVEEWDLTGLGILTLVIENGLVGFLFFSYIVYLIYKKTTEQGKIFVLIFYFIFFFGVQLYFLYPWFSLAIALAFFSKRRFS